MNCVLKPINDMYFKDVHSLYNNINVIKEKYFNLDNDYKTIYKWFFFNQLSLLCDYKNNPIKSILWEYINDICDYATLENSYFQFIQFQKKRNEQCKNKKRPRN